MAHSLDYKIDEARIKFEQSLLLFENLVEKDIMAENYHAATLRYYGQMEHTERNYERAEELLVSALDKFTSANEFAPFHESMLFEATKIIGSLAEARLELGKLELAKENMAAADDNISYLEERNPESVVTQSLRGAAIARDIRLMILESSWTIAKSKLDELSVYTDALKPDYAYRAGFEFSLIDHRIMLASYLAIANLDEEALEQLNIAGEQLDAFQVRHPDYVIYQA